MTLERAPSDFRIQRLGQRGLPFVLLFFYIYLSRRTNAMGQLAARVMRCLCSIHLFHEKDEDVFVNNRISSSLAENEHLRAYIMLLYVS